MKNASLALPDPEATARLGRWLAFRLGAGDVLLLEGPIGAGKTHLARALIQARLADAGLAEDVPSPTFTLVQVYEAGDLAIWHSDLYRLSHPDEVAELGLDEAFSTALCLIEWPDRLGSQSPSHAITLRLVADGDARRAEFVNLPKALAADLERGLPDD
ncbi:MAG: tRNA (adenosine(37)-N6)-threonylcarbamoyltransferase complex ATPase subunit type 1 TsaE [Gemmobacter sp.]|nr:tRNA (adenosine(37)-N6)-threonylcarbamoyltransferase complex ATPase subunit type 1 TsaE [Gemmobacter sp.]